MTKDNLTIVYVPIEELVFADYNPRRATADQTDQLEKNIREFGFVDPILVNSNPDRKNIIIGGHFRVRVAKKIGMKEVPVVYIDIADIEKEKELNVRLNKNTGEWDWDLLSSHFDTSDLLAWGFSEGEFGMDIGEKNKEIDPTSLDGKSTITLSFSGEKYHEILELLQKAKEDYGFETNEELIEDLLKNLNVQL